MMYYLSLYNYYLFQFDSKACSLLIFLLLSIIYNVYLYMIYQIFHELYLEFYDRTNVGFFTHKNPWNQQWILVPLDYKIFDLKITCLRILFFFFLGLGPLLILRIVRLGTKINLLFYYKILSLFPIIPTFILCITFIHFLIFISIIYVNIYARLHKELKKLYIYLLQFGGKLDSNTYTKLDKKDYHKMKEAYIYDYFLKPINEYSSLKFTIFLYELTKKLQNDSTYQKKYIINNKVTELIIFLLIEIELSIPLFYKSIFYIIPIFTIIYEIYFHNYTLYYTYYIFFYLLIYKQLYNLMYFSWHHNLGKDKILNFYYYKDFKLLSMKSDYARHISILYNVHANKVNNEILLYYLNTALNNRLANATINNKDWPEYPNYYKKLLKIMKILKENSLVMTLIIGNIILMYLGLFCINYAIIWINNVYPIQSPLTIQGNILYLKDYFILKIQHLSIDKQIYLLKIFKTIPFYDLLQSKTMYEIKMYVDNFINTYEYMENNIYPFLKNKLAYQINLEKQNKNFILIFIIKFIKSLIYFK